jgi:hypothetical protein
LLYALEYLEGELRAPVPAGVLEELRVAAQNMSAVERRQALEVMLYGLQYSFAGGRRALLRQAGSWPLRMQMLRCFLFPSVVTLLAAGEIGSARRQRNTGERA